MSTFVAARNIRLFAAFNFFSDFRLYAPIAILYFTAVGGSFTRATSVLAVAMIASSAFELPAGLFSDLRGRRDTMVFGAVASAAALIIYAAAPTYAFLLVGAVLEGLSRALYSGNNEALLYDTLAADARRDTYSEQLGRVSQMLQWALATAAVAGSLLADVSFRLVMWLSVLPQLVCIVLSLRVVEPPLHARVEQPFHRQLAEALKAFVGNVRLRWLTVASISSFALGEATYQFRAAFVSTLWPIWAIGFVNVMANIAAAISFRLSGRLIKLMPEPLWLAAGTVYGSLVDLIGVVFPTKASPAIMPTGSMFFGVSFVSRSALLQKEFSDTHRATMGSLQSVAGSLMFALVAVALGALADAYGPARAIFWASVTGFGVALLYLPLVPKRGTRAKTADVRTE